MGHPQGDCLWEQPCWKLWFTRSCRWSQLRGV